MNSTLNPSTSEDELIALDNFLLSDACDDETFAVDELHGFLTGLAVMAEDVDVEKWLDFIWNEPRFADDHEKSSMTDLIRRMSGEIAATLNNRQPFEPLVIETEEDGVEFEMFEGWCFGFMTAVDEQQEQWSRLGDNEQALLTPIAKLALLYDEDDPEMDDDEYTSWVELIPGSVAGLYNHWHH